MWTWTNYNNELYHHGILGQKWGVRRFQNPDGSLTIEGRQRYASQGMRDPNLNRKHVIPSGTKMYRVTSGVDSAFSTSDGSTYVTYLEQDRNLYKGGYIRYQSGSSKAYEHQYTLNHDLVVPSREELISAEREILSKNRKLARETIETFCDMNEPLKDLLISYDYDIDENGNYVDKTDTSKYDKAVKDMVKKYEKFNTDDFTFQSLATLGKNEKLRKELITNLSEKGYNAIMDEASIGGFGSGKDSSMEGVAPMIVFNAEENLRSISTKRVSSKEESKANKEYYRWRNVTRSKNKEGIGW